MLFHSFCSESSQLFLRICWFFFFFVKGNWILFYNNILMQIKLFNMTLENNSDVKNMRHHCKQIRKCSSWVCGQDKFKSGVFTTFFFFYFLCLKFYKHNLFFTFTVNNCSDFYHDPLISVSQVHFFQTSLHRRCEIEFKPIWIICFEKNATHITQYGQEGDSSPRKE